jgi:hypothetical protein
MKQAESSAAIRKAAGVLKHLRFLLIGISLLSLDVVCAPARTAILILAPRRDRQNKEKLTPAR